MVKVREATAADRAAWDAFVDEEGGSFFHYFDWKLVHEAGGRQFIPLLAHTGPSRVAGILPLAREKRLLYSTLDSGGIVGVEGLLLKKDLPDDERAGVISALVDHVDRRCSRGCSSFTLTENLAPAMRLSREPTPALLDDGFRFRYEARTGLPCYHVLQVQPLFEQNVWRGFSEMMRRGVKQAEARGIVVTQDAEMRYAERFVDMVRANYARHHTQPPSRKEVKARLEVFRDRSKMFVALSGGQPVVFVQCHYTPSTCYIGKIGCFDEDTGGANKLAWKAAIEDACAGGYAQVDFGASNTEGLAFFKERFGATRMPLRLYEKRYSMPGNVMHKAPMLFRNTWHDTGYPWRNRRMIWERITGR